jgi:hypothetical protein
MRLPARKIAKEMKKYFSRQFLKVITGGILLVLILSAIACQDKPDNSTWPVSISGVNNLSA